MTYAQAMRWFNAATTTPAQRAAARLYCLQVWRDWRTVTQNGRGWTMGEVNARYVAAWVEGCESVSLACAA